MRKRLRDREIFYLGSWTTASGYRVFEYLVAGHMVYMGFGVIGVYKEESA